MKRNRPSAAYLSAVVAGLIAGSTFAGNALAQDKAAPSNTPAASQKDKNACSGPNGCGSKRTGDKKAGPEATDKHACKGQNACKGKGGCKTEKNACKGHNDCKGMGGCATDGKAHTMPTQKPA
ncbi:MAG: hypothetical protein IPL90_13130 [Holophagales bacterium]|nr:hypothetical protein [Holophagales bacterium]